MNNYYQALSKRKTIRRFDPLLTITDQECQHIQVLIDELEPLEPNIHVTLKLSPIEATSSKRGQYAILCYSEKKEHYLENVGYLLEQLDLALLELSIGVCWYALAKAKKTSLEGLDYVIMLAIGKVHASMFRTSPKDFKRKTHDEIWEGDDDHGIAKILRLAPSACNTQSWYVKATKERIDLYRRKDIKSFIPTSKLPYYNSIDSGIAMLFISLALRENKLDYQRKLHKNTSDSTMELMASFLIE